MPIKSSSAGYHLFWSATLQAICSSCLNFFFGRNTSTLASNLGQKLPHRIRNYHLHRHLAFWIFVGWKTNRSHRSCLDILASKFWCEAYLPCRFCATHCCQFCDGSSSCSFVLKTPSRTKICSINFAARTNLKLVSWSVRITSW